MKIFSALRLSLLPINLAGLCLSASAMNMPVQLPAQFGHGSARALTVVITSSVQYEALFNQRAPLIDFSQEWLVYFSPGRMPSTGWEAFIVDVRPAPNDAGLKIVTGLVAPGPDCDVKRERSYPFALVRIPASFHSGSDASVTNLRIVGDCTDEAADLMRLRRLAALLDRPAPAFTAKKTTAHAFNLP